VAVVTIIILYFLKEKSDIVEERNKPIVFKDKAKILYKKADQNNLLVCII
jgi:hypothetical protein